MILPPVLLSEGFIGSAGDACAQAGAENMENTSTTANRLKRLPAVLPGNKLPSAPDIVPFNPLFFKIRSRCVQNNSMCLAPEIIH